MKKLVAIILTAVILVGAGVGFAKLAEQNKNLYCVEATCEQDGNLLIFTFADNAFVWELGADDKAPQTAVVVLTMHNNGTPGFLEDDSIIKW